MPTYEYACTGCGNAWEEVQKISEPALEVCPKCNQSTAKRQISGGRFILKGGGWYADLYSSVKPGGGSKDGASAASSTSDSAAKSDSSTSASAPAKSESSASSPPPASTPTKT